MRGAASAIGADATEFGSVGLHAGTAREFKLGGSVNLWSADTSFTSLYGLFYVHFTRPDNAKSGLFLQSALSVVIGYPG